eukprot:SAG31_NODE_23626_length_500_cov_0.897756_1_plen_30_part_10
MLIAARVGIDWPRMVDSKWHQHIRGLRGRS